jgi:hypothetical protein
MDKLQLTGLNLGRVFNSRSGCVLAMLFHCSETKLSNLKLKTGPEQHLSSLPLDITLPALCYGMDIRNFNAFSSVPYVIKENSENMQFHSCLGKKLH